MVPELVLSRNGPGTTDWGPLVAALGGGICGERLMSVPGRPGERSLGLRVAALSFWSSFEIVFSLDLCVVLLRDRL